MVGRTCDCAPLQGRKDFADGIKLGIFRWALSWMTQAGPMSSPEFFEEGVRRLRVREGMRMEAEAGGMCCVGMEGGAKDAEPLEAGKGRRRSSWGPRKNQPCPHWGSAPGDSVWTSQLQKREVTNLRCLPELRAFARQPQEAHAGGSDSLSVRTNPSSLKYQRRWLHLLGRASA